MIISARQSIDDHCQADGMRMFPPPLSLLLSFISSFFPPSLSIINDSLRYVRHYGGCHMLTGSTIRQILIYLKLFGIFRILYLKLHLCGNIIVGYLISNKYGTNVTYVCIEEVRDVCFRKYRRAADQEVKFLRQHFCHICLLCSPLACNERDQISLSICFVDCYDYECVRLI